MGLTYKPVRDRLAVACRSTEGVAKVYGTVPPAPIYPALVLRPRVPTKKPGPGFGHSLHTWQFSVLVLLGQLAKDAAQDRLAEWDDRVHAALHGLKVGNGYVRVMEQNMIEIPVGATVMTVSDTSLIVFA